MSHVFDAIETRLGRRVVVKLLTPELAADVSAERFEREIRLAAALQHPNIVPLLSAGDAGGLPFYTMPFVDGLSLRARIDRDRALPVADTISILRDIARALAYAHEHGVVHRDIKPDNILLSDDAAVVTDFGIAKALSASRTQAPSRTLTQVGTSIGTPAYMAPEQAAGDPATDHRADIYALGCVAYELLAGQPPFANRSTHQLFTAHMGEPPVPIVTHRADVPALLGALVMKCLEKDPARRPQSAREVLQTLDAVSTGGARVVPSGGGRRWKPAGEAIAGVALVAAAAFMYRAYGTRPRMDDARSIAVIPFRNASSDTTANYFADGVSDEVAGMLAKLPALRVASRRSVDIVRAKQATPQEIGKALSVGLLLEGSVRRSGDQLRVTAQLTNATDGSMRWSKSYDGTVRNPFQLQDDIATAIAAELRMTIGDQALAAARAGRTANAEAYDLFLRGRYVETSETEAGLRQALVFFQRALTIDPQFARAQAAIGFAWTFLADAYVPAAEAYPHAREAAQRALALDSLLADAHAVYGYATTVFYWDASGIREIRRATELDPNSPDWHFFYGQVLCIALTDCAAGAREMDRAAELDPLAPLPQWGRAQANYLGKRYDDAIIAQRRLAQIDPHFFYLDDYGAAALREKGDYEAALRAYVAAQRTSPIPLFGMAVTYARMGRVQDALRLARELETARGRQHVLPDGLAMIYAALGDRDQAFHWLEEARREHSPVLLGFEATPEYASLKDDPRFPVFAKKLGRLGMQ